MTIWPKNLSNTNGVTLVEVLVVVLLFTTLMGVAFSILLASSDSWEVNKRRIELQQELRKAVDWIKEDLRQTGLGGITEPTPFTAGTVYTSITFHLSEGILSGGAVDWTDHTFQYSLIGTSPDQMLQRQKDLSGTLTNQTIAQNINTLTFERTSAEPNIVVVTIVASRDSIKGGTITLNYDFKVKLRN